MAFILSRVAILSLAIGKASVSANPLLQPVAQGEALHHLGLVLDNPDLHGDAPARGQCTSNSIFHPDFTIGPVQTVWTTTTTTTNYIDCGACAKYTINLVLLGIPPVNVFSTTTTVTAPSTTSVIRCGSPPADAEPMPRYRRDSAPTTLATRKAFESTSKVQPSPRYYKAPGDALVPTVVTPPTFPNPRCTSSTGLSPRIPDFTYTAYPSTVTSSKTIDCGSCAVAWTTEVLQFLLPIRYTTTTSPATPSTKTDLICASTAAPGSGHH